MNDEMVNDIFDQQFKKPRKNLNQLKPYKDDEYLGDDDFDIAYRTPANIDVTDLLPTEFIEAHPNDKYNDIMNKNNNAYGLYNVPNDEIIVLNKPAIKEKYNKINNNILKTYDEQKQQKYITNAYNEILLHEHTHQKCNKKEDAYVNSSPLIISEYNDSYINSPEIIKDIITHRKKHDKIKLPNQIFNIFNNIPEERISYPAGWFPEDIINPTTKLTKTINRIFFD
jgi:hypothetical protein